MGTPLQITTRPASATLTLDGSPIDNPYDAMHPQGGSHIVEATAPGYRSQNLTIDLKQKRSVALELEKAPEPKRAAAPRPKRQPRSSKTARIESDCAARAPAATSYVHVAPSLVAAR